jgi:two-component system cell cycle response regulator
MVARILIIEDDPPSLELMLSTLSAFGFDVLGASTGLAGLEQARAARPDLIVCDIQLPDIDGLLVARALKSDPLLREVPLIGASACAAPVDRADAAAAGFDAYLTKPLDFAQLLSTLRRFTVTPQSVG